jgi:CDP-diacylglycerol--inositol 3-phosphatidyltransferase
MATDPFEDQLHRKHQNRKKISSSSYPTSSVRANLQFLPKLPADTHTGYTRIILAIISLYYMPVHPRRCCFLYSVSCLLDAVDGLAARRFNQSTKFGAVLDMVTDRCTTACLLVFLASAFPRWAIIFQGLISLDLASHYLHMYATLTMGGSGQSHKKVDEGRSWILKMYYSNNVGALLLAD